MAGLCIALAARSQNDSSRQHNAASAQDTIHIGTMTIIKGGDGKNSDDGEYHKSKHHNAYHTSNVSTEFFQMDLGFTNFNDMTNYASAGTQQFAPGATNQWFRLRDGKSVTVDLWFFMQRINLIKHVVNLKYGLGLELNNYRYPENIKFLKSPVSVIMDSISYRKNKLAADYLTIPVMLNFDLTPHHREHFGFSAGMSFGYLYSARQKLISHEFGKTKTHDDFNLRPWKISYIAELELGPLSLFGTYATQSIFKYGLDQTPYTIGLRFGNW
jgi:hypothetical protein